MNFVIFDLETTGLSPKTEQIIEIAAKKVNEQGEELGLFHKFVSLYKVNQISDFIMNLTNITHEMLDEKGEDIIDVLNEFEDFCEGCVLVAQNAKFDMSFLMHHYLTQEDRAFSPLCLDTIDLAKHVKPGMDSYKLAKLVEYFDVDYDSNAHHRADYDVKITTDVFLKQLEAIHFKGDINELLEVISFSLMTEKQESFLNALMGQNNHFVTGGHVFSKNTASFHIDFYLNNK